MADRTRCDLGNLNPISNFLEVRESERGRATDRRRQAHAPTKADQYTHNERNLSMGTHEAGMAALVLPGHLNGPRGRGRHT